jgi:hypothetical protein
VRLTIIVTTLCLTLAMPFLFWIWIPLGLVALALWNSHVAKAEAEEIRKTYGGR